MKSAPKRLSAGFTLIELLIVIGILGILLAIVIVALNPARQFSQANNTKRNSHVNTILNAIGLYAADNNGAIPANIPSGTAQTIGNGAGEADICADLVPLYIAQFPADPTANNGDPVADCAAPYSTGYTVVTSAANNRVTVGAPNAELSEVISVTR